MTPEDVIRLIRQELTSSNVGYEYNVSHIPFHQHTRQDSSQVSYEDILDNELYSVNQFIILTSAQILTLHATPVSLIPALGPKVVTIVQGVTGFLNFCGTAYTGANNVEFRYTNGTGVKVATDMTSTFLNSTTNTYTYSPATSSSFTPVANTPIVAVVPVANPGAGNSILKLFVNYRIVVNP